MDRFGDLCCGGGSCGRGSKEEEDEVIRKGIQSESNGSDYPYDELFFFFPVRLPSRNSSAVRSRALLCPRVRA